MKGNIAPIYLRIVFLILLFSTGNLFAQKIIAFDKSGKVKRIRYYRGDLIKLNLKSGDRVYGTIDQILDSSFVVEGRAIELNEVTKVYNTQKLAGFKLLGKVFVRAGLAYFPLVTTNRLINNDDPIYSEQAAIISGSFLTAAIICKIISNKSYKISDNRPLKILDLAP